MSSALVMIVDALVASGSTPEQISAAVRAYEAARESDINEKRAKATAKKRAQRLAVKVSPSVPDCPRDNEGQSGTTGDNTPPPSPQVSPLEIYNSTPLPPPHPSSQSSLRSDFLAQARENALDANAFFERLWPIIPKRRGDAPKATKKALFKALAGGVPKETIWAGLERYAEAERHADPEFRKGAAVWINNAGWEADYTPSPARAPPRGHAGIPKTTILTQLTIGAFDEPDYTPDTNAGGDGQHPAITPDAGPRNSFGPPHESAGESPRRTLSDFGFTRSLSG